MKTQALLVALHFVLGFGLLKERQAFSAACCGGGGNFPALIVSDDFAQMQFGTSLSRVIGDAPHRGKSVFRASDDDEWVWTNTVDAATLLSDRWQTGLQLPLQQRRRGQGKAQVSHTGLGDLSLSTGYEFLVDYTYSSWRPRAWLFAQLLLPTGGNMFESDQPYAVDAHGRGLVMPSIGAVLTRNWGAWDASARFAVGRAFQRNFQSLEGEITRVQPGFEGSVALGLGYSPGQAFWRGALLINPSFRSGTSLRGRQQVWDTRLELSRLIAQTWSLSLAYFDQSLLGPAHNTTLERGGSFSVRYKWAR